MQRNFGFMPGPGSGLNIPKHKVIGGKEFFNFGLRTLKSNAQKDAVNLRKHGKLARIEHYKDGYYVVWARKKS